MNKTKLIALSGVCAAVAVLCVWLAAYVKWVALMLAVVASVAVAVPLVIDARYGLYSVFTYIAASILGVILGFGNIVYVAPIVTFAMPFAMWKVFAESKRVKDGNEVPRVPVWAKWIVFFVLCEVAVAITAGATYLVTPVVFENILAYKYFWLIPVAVNLAVPVYNVLMNGCIYLTRNALAKSHIM
ncbi:MAG: hypothetical protein NC350_00260 [Corallococcus sp.]|nr:hypothetical protein [Corallococcus sp.]